MWGLFEKFKIETPFTQSRYKFPNIGFSDKNLDDFLDRMRNGYTGNPNETKPKQNETQQDGEKMSIINLIFHATWTCFLSQKNLDKWFLKPLSSTDKSPLILHGSIIPVSSFNFFYLNSEKVELFGEIMFSKHYRSFLFQKWSVIFSISWFVKKTIINNSRMPSN